MASHFTPQQYSEIEHKALSLPADIAGLNPNGRTKTCADNLEKARIQALRTAQELTRALERPEDVIIRYAFMPIHGMCIRTALDMGLYEMLTTGGERQKSAKEMAQMLTGHLKEGPMEEAGSEKTNTTTLTDERQNLIVRILRVLTAIGFFNEDDMEMYSANALTQTMTNAKYVAMIKHCFDVVLPPTTTTPAYLANESFTMPASPSLTPFQKHHSHPDPPSSYFAYLAAHPSLNVNFNTFMQGNRLARPFWGDWFSVQERLLDGFSALGNRKEVHRILMVDVAGGLGHDLISFKQRFPHIVGTGQATELLLQEQPHIVEEIERKGGLGEGIRCEIYDFFSPQPVHGAYIYFHHFILHDWDDASCRQILANTAAAMKPGYSKLILNEIVLPDKGAPLQMALWDLQMMVVLGGMERTERAWRQLLSSVGLDVLGIWQPPAASGGRSGGEGIIEAVRKGS